MKEQDQDHQKIGSIWNQLECSWDGMCYPEASWAQMCGNLPAM